MKLRQLVREYSRITWSLFCRWIINHQTLYLTANAELRKRGRLVQQAYASAVSKLKNNEPARSRQKLWIALARAVLTVRIIYRPSLQPRPVRIVG